MVAAEEADFGAKNNSGYLVGYGSREDS